jgi:flavorubredoxin
VIVDTGCAINRQQWLEDVFAIVAPDDVRWVFLSHGDRDHVGNLDAVLDACPNATVVSTMFGVRYLQPDGPPPLDRMCWVNDGETFAAGDRTLVALRPPVWDGANTRGLFDPTTGVYWAADAFASMLTSPVTDARDLDHEFWRTSFLHEHLSYCEWHTMLDPDRFDAHVARTERVATTLASAHGPVVTGARVADAYAMIRAISRMDAVAPAPQSELDRMVRTLADAA